MSDYQIDYILPGRQYADASSANGLMVGIVGLGLYKISVDGIDVIRGDWLSPSAFNILHDVYQENTHLIYVLSQMQKWVIDCDIPDLNNPSRWFTLHSFSSQFMLMLLFAPKSELVNFRQCLYQADKQLKAIYNDDRNKMAGEIGTAVFFHNIEFRDEISWLEMFADIEDKEGYVYILPVEDANGISYKIGKTVNPTSRVKTFSVELPYPDVKFSHLLTTPNLHRAEKILHRHFRKARKGLAGEWFALEEGDIADLDKLQLIRGFNQLVPQELTF